MTTSSQLILVVDDNVAGLELVRFVLEIEGFRVETAASSGEVLQRLKVNTPDLILMDVQLPGQDGLSLTRQLKADPASSHIPIVALTAHAMEGDREQALAAGCSGYVTKPINTRTFGEEVKEFLSAELPEPKPLV